jgi:retron-type reverse transcriptase
MYIPKADGKQRPLAIAALEDKIVQGAAVMVLNARSPQAANNVGRGKEI